MAGLIDVIASKAPLLATVLGSPAAGIGLSLLANVFGVSAGDVTAISDAVQNDPEANQKLAELEAQHSLALAQLASSDYATEVDDRKNARSMETNLAEKGTGILPYVPFILAIVFVGIYALVQFTAVFYPAPTDDLISARVQDILVMIISYFYGSSNKKIRQS